MFITVATQSIEMVLGSTPPVPLSFYASYADQRDRSPGTNNGQSNGQTAVTVVPGPSGIPRNIRVLHIYNPNNSAVAVTVQLNDNGTLRIFHTIILDAGEMISYEHHFGWRVLTANGASKSAGTSIIPVVALDEMGRMLAPDIRQLLEEISLTLKAQLQELQRIRS
jgi:hypothetical protein